MLVASPDYDAPGDAGAAPLAEAPKGTLPLISRVKFTPLPGTAEEAAAVRPLLPSPRVQIDRVATETALKQVATSADLLASAGESAAVALDRYQAGVGTILDLLSAQRALAEARAQAVLARSDWLISVARLAHDTGRLHGPEPASEEN